MSIAPRILQLACAAVAVGAACILPIEARASVGLCKCAHSGEVAEDKSELRAKKLALESWIAHASRYGEGYTRWGIAWNRRLDCTRTDVGLFRCKANGHPCTVAQVPPDDFVRLKRGTSNPGPSC
jgi:hypothetical protein